MPAHDIPAGPLFFLSAGEASGEHYAVGLMEALRARMPDTRFFGLGGARMMERGFRSVVRSEAVAHVGITEVVRHAPYIYRQFQRLKRAVLTERPAIAVLIDFPDVNLRLAEHLHRHGVPVVYFVSPQLWAWKKRRIRRVQRFVDRMLVIFPFEESFYRERGVEATFVGHPLVDVARPEIARQSFARQYGLDASKAWVALLPGSRPREVELNLPAMLETMRALGDGYEYVVPVAPTIKRERMTALLPAAGRRPVLVDDARAALSLARASVVASGTATVEAALIGNPFIVVYRLSPLSYAIARRVVTVPHVAMANLIADRRVVPELIQDEFTPQAVVAALRPLLEDGTARERMIADLKEVRERLQGDGETTDRAVDRVADICMELLGSPRQSRSGAAAAAKQAEQEVTRAGTYHA